MNDLTKPFDMAMLSIHHRAKTEAGYRASAFLGMLNARGGLETARRLINSTKPSEGYTRLWELGRLDLTVEATIVDNARWHPLFRPEELDRARKRLRDYGYEVSTMKAAGTDRQ
jgi:hypothetical protein